MTDASTIARLGLSGVAVAETAATWTRWEHRRRLFQAADARAREQGRPLLVVLPPLADDARQAHRAVPDHHAEPAGGTPNCLMPANSHAR